eukprot:g2579.t1
MISEHRRSRKVVMASMSNYDSKVESGSPRKLPDEKGWLFPSSSLGPSSKVAQRNSEGWSNGRAFVSLPPRPGVSGAPDFSSSLMDVDALRSILPTTQSYARSNMDGRRRANLQESLGLGRKSSSLAMRRRNRRGWQRMRKGNQEEEAPALRARRLQEEEDRDKMAKQMGLTAKQMQLIDEAEKNDAVDEEAMRAEYLAAFREFDVDGSGAIDAEELEQVLNYLGEDLDAQDVKKIAAEADKDGDGQIDYEEFVEMMKARKKLLSIASKMAQVGGRGRRRKLRQRRTAAKSGSVDPPIPGSPKSGKPLPELKLSAIRGRRNIRQINQFRPRNTPKVLRRGSYASARELRRELDKSDARRAFLDMEVKRNVEWVQKNCPVTNIRAQMFSKKWGMEKLEQMMTKVQNARLTQALGKWIEVTEFDKCQEMAERYMKWKGSRTVISMLFNKEHSSILAAFNQWNNTVIRMIAVERNDAVVALQRVSRGFNSRKRVERIIRNRAATIIQSMARYKQGRNRCLAQKLLRHRNDSAERIQTTFRNWHCRRIAKVFVQKIREEKAVGNMQRVFRGHRGRQIYEKKVEHRNQNLGAGLLQRQWRGRQGRKIYAHKLEKKKESDSATLIQSHQRRRVAAAEVQVRRVKRAKVNVAFAIQNRFRGRKSRAIMQAIREDRRRRANAAARIQARARGNKQRILYAERLDQEDAARRMQAVTRGRQAKRYVKEVRIQKNAAATSLQNMYRTREARRFVNVQRLHKKQRNEGAKMVQAQFRGHRVRKQQEAAKKRRLAAEAARKRNNAAVQIQSFLRKQQGNYAEFIKNRAQAMKDEDMRREAAMRIQAKRRGHTQRRKFVQQQEASKKIAAITRGKQGRKKAWDRRIYGPPPTSGAEEALYRLKKEKMEVATVKMQSIFRGVAQRKDRKKMSGVASKRKQMQAESDARLELVRLNEAASKLQGRWRVKLARDKIRKKREANAAELASAATPEERERLKKKQAEEMAALQMAGQIKTLMSEKLAKKKEDERKEAEAAEKRRIQKELEKHAATLLQKIYRSKRDRERCANLVAEIKAKYGPDSSIAEIRLQNAKKRRAELGAKITMHADSAEKAKMEAATTQLQCLFRSNRARQVRRKKQAEFEAREKEIQQQNEAALKFQGLFRGKKARSKYEEKKAQYEKKRQALLRQEGMKEELERLKRQQDRELCALRVQSIMRARWARRATKQLQERRARARREVLRRQNEKNSAIIIQSMFRSRRDRKQMAALRRQVKMEKRKKMEAEKEAAAMDSEATAVQEDKWIEYWDEAAAAYYWYNPRTQEARWEDPNAEGYESTFTAGTATDYDTDNMEYAGMGGEYGYDQQQQQQQYDAYGNQSSESTYGYDAYGNANAASSYYDDGSAYSGQSDSVWTTHVDEQSGREYYFNSQTGETQWV